MTAPRSAVMSRVAVALSHAALDPPDGAVAAWKSLDPAAFLGGPLPAGAMGLLPLVWRNLDAAGFSDDSMPLLKGLARRTWLVNRSSLDDLGSALAVLEAGTIPTTLLGGAAAALAPWGWSGDLKFRGFDDAAVMVPAAECERATRLLRDAGWSTGPARWARRHTRLWQEVVVSSPAGLAVRLVSRPSRWLDEPDWWRRGPAMPVGTVRSATLDATDAFLVVCLDGIRLPHRHHLWVIDASRIVTVSGVDLARCEQVAARNGAGESLAAARRFLADEFGVPLATPPPSPGDLPTRRDTGWSPLRADWVATRSGRRPWRTIADLPAFLADRWALESIRRVPQEAGRRVLHRLRRRTR